MSDSTLGAGFWHGRCGGRLMARTNQDRVNGNQRITDDLEIVLPKGLSIESRGGSGDHEVADVDVGCAILTRRRGDAEEDAERTFEMALSASSHAEDNRISAAAWR